MERNKEYLTLDERLKCMQESRAISPAHAAAKVCGLSQMPFEKIFYSHRVLKHMWDLTDGFREAKVLVSPSGCRLEQRQYELGDYGKFAPFLLNVRERYFIQQAYRLMGRSEKEILHSLLWGADMNNAMLLLALSVLDGVRDGRIPFLRMTLGDYLDALIDLSFREDGQQDEKRTEEWRGMKAQMALKNDLSQPFPDFLAGLVRDYMTGKVEIDRLNYLVACQKSIEKSRQEAYFARCKASYRMENPTSEDTTDARIHKILAEAREFSVKMPELWDKNTKMGRLGDKLFLYSDDYLPERFLSAFPEGDSALRELAMEIIGQEKLTKAVSDINYAVYLIFELLVCPYLELEEYHYVRHLED